MENTLRKVVIGLALVCLGLPMLTMMIALMSSSAIVVGSLNRIGSGERVDVERTATADDLDFGGGVKQLTERRQRLESLMAKAADGRRPVEALTVAIVTLTTDRTVVPSAGASAWSWLAGAKSRAERTKPITIDLGQAGRSGLLLIADRPVLWSPVGAKRSHHAMIAMEGRSVFDVVDTPPGLLAGFRIAAFGGSHITDPADAEPGASRTARTRFCRSVARWAHQFEVEPGDVRLWRFTDPDRIAVARNRLEQSGGTESKPEFLSELCRA